MLPAERARWAGIASRWTDVKTVRRGMEARQVGGSQRAFHKPLALGTSFGRGLRKAKRLGFAQVRPALRRRSDTVEEIAAGRRGQPMQASDFHSMMVRAPRAVDLLRKLPLATTESSRSSNGFSRYDGARLPRAGDLVANSPDLPKGLSKGDSNLPPNRPSEPFRDR